MYTKKNVEVIVIIEPNDATVFHCVYASGKSGIRLGIPDRPKKCIGKKVILTPIKVVQKCILPSTSGYVVPTILPIQ
jgi:hypothetical protein